MITNEDEAFFILNGINHSTIKSISKNTNIHKLFLVYLSMFFKSSLIFLVINECNIKLVIILFVFYFFYIPNNLDIL